MMERREQFVSQLRELMSGVMLVYGWKEGRRIILEALDDVLEALAKGA